jgi:antitoxin YefM
MTAVTEVNLLQNLNSCMDRVFADCSPLVVTRKNEENVVIMSMPEYNSLVETAYLLSSPANAAHLARSLDQYRAGAAKEHDLVRV